MKLSTTISLSTVILLSILWVNLFASPYGAKISGLDTDQFREFQSLLYLEADSTHDFEVLKYELSLKPYDIADALAGNEVITFEVKQNDFSQLVLHSQDLSILSVIRDSIELSFQVIDNELIINLAVAYQIGDTVSVEIDYTAPIYELTQTLGFHKTSNGYTFTISEPFGARKWFPCYDYPFDKAQAEIFLYVPEAYKAASNGNLIEVIPYSADTVIFHWKEDDPLATYLISLACGPYAEITAVAADTIPLLYYIYPEDSADAAYDFANTGDMLEFFSQTFGAYPFQMYGMAEGGLYNGWGAMEHQTMTTFGYHLITGDRMWENVVSHELSHMWWGDCLTPLTFADIWLNEGFAVYSECLYIEARYDTLAEYLDIVADRYFGEYNAGYNYAIYNPPPELLFGEAVYNKGAYVQHMLRKVVGDSAFFTGLKNYYQDYSYNNVVTAEYISEMETVYGGDLDWFFNQWVFDTGFPHYDYDWSVQSVGQDFQVDFTLRQIQSDGPIFQMPVEIKLSSGINSVTSTVWNEQAVQNYTFTLGFAPNLMELDPNDKILKWDLPAGVEMPPVLTPITFALQQNYPNPFNSSTVIPFRIDHQGVIQLEIYNLLGNKVSEIYNGTLVKGSYHLTWEASDYSSGIYYAVLSGDRARQVIKIQLLK